MLGGSTLGIGVTMFLRDQFSGPSARIRNSAKATQADMLRMQEAQLRQQRNLYGGLAIAGGLALRNMGRVVRSAAKFGFEMEFVKQISKSTTEEQEKLSAQSMKLGQSTIFFARDVAEGMRFMAMAGMGYKEITGNIAAAVNLAAAANLSIAGRGGAADIMTNIMKAFQKEASESAYTADILAEAATSANLNVFELGESLKYAGSTSVDLGFSLEQTAAMAMTLANAGMQGSMAGVAMENSMRYLARAVGPFASGKMRKALVMAGLSADDFKDANGNLLPMIQNISTLKTALRGMDNIKTSGIQIALFGVRGKRAGALLIRNLEEYREHLKRFEGAQGTASRISGGMMGTLEGSFLRLESMWNSLGILFGKALEPVLKPLLFILEKIVELTQWIFKVPIIGNFMASALAGFVTFHTIAFGVKTIMTGIRLITIQNTATMTSYASSTIVGYNSMTAAATRFGTAAMASGVSQNIGALQAGTSFGLIARSKTGRLYRQKGKTGQGLISKKLAGRYMSIYGAGIGAQAATRAGTGMALKGVLSRFVGFMGGPWGLALSFILPGVIGALVAATKGNTNEIKKATDAQRVRLQSNMKYERIGHMLKFQDLVSPRVNLLGTTSSRKTPSTIDQVTLNALTKKLDTLLNTPQKQPINIYIDNELAIQKILDENEKSSFNFLQ